ncbi:MAG: SHD1 domain-containing protein [Thermoguttaceae bacterium]|nr:SHD1 domain-containing protein [Thermoguttaceae bacterium]
MQRLFIFVLLVLSFLSPDLIAGESRTWTSASGEYTTIATLEEVVDDGASVILKKENGKRIKVVVAQLSESDQTYIAQSRNASPQSDGQNSGGSTNETDDLPTYPYEVSLGMTLKEIHSRCEISEEKYDKLSNWRILTIKPKNSSFASITAIFRNENTLGYYEISFAKPSKALTIKIYKMLRKSFDNAEELKFNSSQKGKESSLTRMYKRPEGGNGYLSYSRDNGESSVSLTFAETAADADIPEALKTILYSVAKDGVLEILKAPSTAVFMPIEKTTFECTEYGKCFCVYIFVDAQNSYGAMLRARYAVPVIYENGTANLDPTLHVVEVKRGEKYFDARIREIQER